MTISRISTPNLLDASSDQQRDAYLSNLLQKHLLKLDPTAQKSLRLSNLISKLKEKPFLRKRASIIYFLFCLADQQHKDVYNAAATSTASSLTGLAAGLADISFLTDKSRIDAKQSAAVVSAKASVFNQYYTPVYTGPLHFFSPFYYLLTIPFRSFQHRIDRV